MNTRPILFSAPMVQAILNETKTMTRRVVKPQPPDEPLTIGGRKWGNVDGKFYYCGIACPYGQPGDRLWVRETWTQDDRGGVEPNGQAAVYYRADMPDGVWAGHWKPSIFMPRWASRITLEITGVRVERLQDISENDAKAEGVRPVPFTRAGWAMNLVHKDAFTGLWDEINGNRAAWTENPFVWVIEFRRVEAS